MSGDGDHLGPWCLLGPVRLVVAGRQEELGPAKQRCVLAVLLLAAGRTIPVEALISRVWGDRPPRAGSAAAAPYVTRLRRILDAVAPDGELGALRYADGGYRLDCDPDLVDVHRARRQAGAAHDARRNGDELTATKLLRRALTGWQPVALAGLSGEWAARARESLRRERLDLLGRWAAATLRLDRPTEVVEELRAPVAEDPTAEELVAPLLVALAGTGRSAEALDCFARVRAAIAGEFGTEPSPRLQDLHLRILRNDPTLIRSRAAAGPDGPLAAGPDGPLAAGQPVVVPAQLPADVAGFTGRDAALDALLAEPGPATVAAISGTAGVGKTTLAVRWARRVADRFPDGQLYADLRGHDPDQPLPPDRVLAVFLRALGVPGPAVPAELEERAALYRSLLAHRRILMVLDNAASVEQLRHLLPGAPSCLTLVTSRDSLPALVARFGATRIELDLLPVADAVDLLRTLVGDRLDGAPAAAAKLAERAARLPLALRIAAEHLASHATATVDELIEELSDERHRLDLLDAGGEERTAVRAVFSWSYRCLDAAEARAFRMLGLHPGPDFDVGAVAALLGADRTATRRLVDRLVRVHLVQAGGAHHRMHDLLRAYAAECARQEPEPVRRAAQRRLVDHYLAVAALAMNAAVPAERHRRPPAPVPTEAAPAFVHAAAARAWLDANRANLVSAVGLAADRRWPEAVTALVDTLWRYLELGAYLDEAAELNGLALQLATEGRDRAGEAVARRRLAVIEGRLGRYGEATIHARTALRIFDEIGDRMSAGQALNVLGAFQSQLGRYEQSHAALERALGIFTELGERVGAAVVLSNIARLFDQWGRHDEAIATGHRALDACTELDDRSGIGRSLAILGEAYLHQDRYDEALPFLRRSLAIFRAVGARVFEGRTMASIAAIYGALGRGDEAFEAAREALVASRDLGDREGEAAALDALGVALRAIGNHREAVDSHTAALALARRTDDRRRVASSLIGLADAVAGDGRPADAVEHYRVALAVARETDDGRAEARAAAALAQLGADPHQRAGSRPFIV